MPPVSASRRDHDRGSADHACRARAHLRSELRRVGRERRPGGRRALPPFRRPPGRRFLYSTGSYHLLGAPLGAGIPPDARSGGPIYEVARQMALWPHGLLRSREMWRSGGVWKGQRATPRSWIDASWTPWTRSSWFGDAHGYGAQMLFAFPDLALKVSVTSDPTQHASSRGYVGELNALLAETIILAAEAASGALPFHAGADPNSRAASSSRRPHVQSPSPHETRQDASSAMST